jgi:hypothetical protein
MYFLDSVPGMVYISSSVLLNFGSVVGKLMEG